MLLPSRIAVASLLLAALPFMTLAAPPSAKIQDASWISGHWQGQALGGFCDEQWSKPMAGAMMGMFRLVKEGKVVFYEFFRLAEEGETLVLRLKHFHHDLRGWEEKDKTVDFPLLKISPDELVFDGMIFRRNGPDSIAVTVSIGEKDGTKRDVKFDYKRVKE